VAVKHHKLHAFADVLCKLCLPSQYRTQTGDFLASSYLVRFFSNFFQKIIENKPLKTSFCVYVFFQFFETHLPQGG
jgi:hypothetical protein